MLDKNVKVNIDVILIFTKIEAKYKSIFREVFHHLDKYSLFAKESDCAIFLQKVELLAYVVTYEGMSI